METAYSPKELTYQDAMRRIQKQFSCDRKEAYTLMQELIRYKCFKLKDEDNQ